MPGRIHSLESFGTVDGPGVRLVVFMQGCPMRCLYCHNPDTWEIPGGTVTQVRDILDAFEKNRSFYRNGGITVTGGEPLLQTDFLTELFEAAKEKDIHTCIDTSGITFSPDNPQYIQKLERLLAFTDLVLLDIKHIDPQKHRELTGRSNEGILAFALFLDRLKIPVWIRHVIVKGYTDDPGDLQKLGYFIGALSNLKALDVLPYHTMGRAKYENLGLTYPLPGVPETDQKTLRGAKESILAGIRARRGDVGGNAGGQAKNFEKPASGIEKPV